jgi:hypothetical protein
MRLGRMILHGAVCAATALSIAPDSSRAQTAATCEPAVGAPEKPLNHSEKGELNSRVTVQTIMLRDTTTGRTRGFVLVERGKEHWMYQGTVERNQASQRVSRSGRDVTGTTSVMIGGPLVSYALGPDSAVVRFMGNTYPLADGNVLLIDRVDEKDEATVQVGGCFAFTDERTSRMYESGRTLFQLILRIPAVAAFVGPVTYPFPPG